MFLGLTVPKVVDSESESAKTTSYKSLGGWEGGLLMRENRRENRREIRVSSCEREGGGRNAWEDRD